MFINEASQNVTRTITIDYTRNVLRKGTNRRLVKSSDKSVAIMRVKEAILAIWSKSSIHLVIWFSKSIGIYQFNRFSFSFLFLILILYLSWHMRNIFKNKLGFSAAHNIIEIRWLFCTSYTGDWFLILRFNNDYHMLFFWPSPKINQNLRAILIWHYLYSIKCFVIGNTFYLNFFLWLCCENFFLLTFHYFIELQIIKLYKNCISRSENNKVLIIFESIWRNRLMLGYYDFLLQLSILFVNFCPDLIFLLIGLHKYDMILKYFPFFWIFTTIIVRNLNIVAQRYFVLTFNPVFGFFGSGFPIHPVFILI